MDARLDSDRFSRSANWLISVRRFPRIRSVTFIFHSPMLVLAPFVVLTNDYFIARFPVREINYVC
jgi:hypothetical protein